MSSLALCEEHGFDTLHHLANHFREANERWNNGFTLQGQSLVEQYLWNGVTIVCDLKFSLHPKGSDGAVSCDDKGHIVPLVASIILRAKTSNGRNLHDWEQRPVFVEDVEIVKGPKGVIPSLIRFYDIHDEISDLFGGLLYQSAIDNCYKVIPGFSHWKFGKVVVMSQPSVYDFVNRNIQRAFEVVRRISNDESNVSWKRVSHFDLKGLLSNISIFIDADTVKVTCTEDQNARVKVSDVLLGPFNL